MRNWHFFHIIFFFSGEDEKERKKRLKEEEKRKREMEEGTEIIEIKEILTPLQEWENSLMSSTSYAQLFMHLFTLDSSIIWAK